MKILVLGCKGQLGRCLNDQLTNTDFQVTYTSRDQIDIADFDNIKKINLPKENCLQISSISKVGLDTAKKMIFKTINSIK